MPAVSRRPLRSPDGDRPTLAMTLAVRGMLAKNPTQKWQLRRLKVFAGNEHKHAAQKPEVLTVE